MTHIRRCKSREGKVTADLYTPDPLRYLDPIVNTAGTQCFLFHIGVLSIYAVVEQVDYGFRVTKVSFGWLTRYIYSSSGTIRSGIPQMKSDLLSMTQMIFELYLQGHDTKSERFIHAIKKQITGIVLRHKIYTTNNEDAKRIKRELGIDILKIGVEA